VWSYATGDSVWPSPAFVNGVVYVGSADGNVYAFATSSSSGSLSQIETYAVIAVGVIILIAIVVAVYMFVGRRKRGQSSDQGMHT
jgi:outer membrane protein assembly factor BamB